MTRDEFMEHAEREICMAFEGRRNRLKNLVEQAWAEGKRNVEIEEISKLIRDAVNRNQRTSAWVSMDEAKPNKDGLYLTWHGKSATLDWLRPEGTDFYVGVTGWYAEKGGWYSAELNMPIKTVTHWMELPAAPEGWG